MKKPSKDLVLTVATVFWVLAGASLLGAFAGTIAGVAVMVYRVLAG